MSDDAPPPPATAALDEALGFAGDVLARLVVALEARGHMPPGTGVAWLQAERALAQADLSVPAAARAVRVRVLAQAVVMARHLVNPAPRH